MRLIVGPPVEFPTPWKLGNKDSRDHQVVLSAVGDWALTCPNEHLAALVVKLVNAYGDKVGLAAAQAQADQQQTSEGADGGD